MVTADNGSMAAGGNINADLGLTRAERIHLLSPESRVPIDRVEAGPGLDNIRDPGLFVGRETVLDDLDRLLAPPGEVVVHVVHGLGGIGKSALAAHWARTRSTHAPKRWINADTPAAIDAGLAAFALALQPTLAGADTDFLRDRAVRWLACHHDWLLVLDNVEDPDHIRPLLAHIGTTTGRILITSRRSTGWHHLATTLTLTPPTREETVELFHRILPRHDRGPDDDTAAVCAELGDLPLALEQAAAYCAETGTTAREYLDLLRAWPAEMFAASPEQGDPSRTIARVWRITLDRLTRTPLAGDVLRSLAWWAPDDIPRRLLDDFAGATPPQVNTAIGRLIAYSMINRNADRLSVHRLVQAVARTPDDEDPHRRDVDIDAARVVATVHLERALPSDWRDPALWPVWRELLPHVDALVNNAAPETDTDYTAGLLSRAGNHLHDQGAARTAVDRLERALDVMRDRGEEGVPTLRLFSDLAAAHVTAGDPDKAVELHTHILAVRARRRGEDDPETSNSRNNLASALQSAGRLREAAEMFERTLADRARILPPDDPYTLNTLNNLATVYSELGRHDEAIVLLTESLATRARTLGPSHRDTWASQHNLACAYRDAGDRARAVPMLEACLPAFVTLLSKQHPNTLDARDNLAACLLGTDADRAVALHEENLAAAIEAYGPKHPATIRYRHNLGCAYGYTATPTKAILVWETAYQDATESLANDHPLRALIAGRLGVAYHRGNDPEKAIPKLREAVDGAIRRHGPRADHTLNLRTILADALRDAQESAQAIHEYQAVLCATERELGKDHVDTLISRYNLAVAYQATGAPKQATGTLEALLTDCRRTLGDLHPLTREVLARRNEFHGQDQQAET
ncbi:FxSxx-COOH system tetratricopeptide repeat protein [Embleya sp. NPDC008237]|uniref:FxSxx-COOH system tetratricopeptide repeat protein n=1 Tax=Embleya sp. NPDC008237 TaxID=3363978 RepID=UPI0036EBA8EA